MLFGKYPFSVCSRGDLIARYDNGEIEFKQSETLGGISE